MILLRPNVSTKEIAQCLFGLRENRLLPGNSAHEIGKGYCIFSSNSNSPLGLERSRCFNGLYILVCCENILRWGNRRSRNLLL